MANKTVLISDDSATARMIIRRCLEVVGCREWQFMEASNGKEALEFLRQNRAIDLLITDMNMPIMDGKSLLLGVKSSPKLNAIPVFVVTSQGNPALEVELIRLGAEKVIYKPISPEKLKDGLEQIFGKEFS